MADTVTANFGWIKPEVGASDDSWGGKINDNYDDIDSEVAARPTSSAVSAAIAAAVSGADDVKIYGTVTGTNTLTASEVTTQTVHYIKPVAANTGAVTFNGKPVKDKDGAALVAGAMQPDVWYALLDDGTNYYVIMSGAVT